MLLLKYLQHVFVKVVRTSKAYSAEDNKSKTLCKLCSKTDSFEGKVA